MTKLTKTIAGLSLIALSGCYAGAGSPVPGLLYADVKTPKEATSVTASAKSGVATCESILGLIGLGDCSIATAKQNGGITQIQSVDYDVKNILGLYATYTTRVRGQ